MRSAQICYETVLFWPGSVELEFNDLSSFAVILLTHIYKLGHDFNSGTHIKSFNCICTASGEYCFYNLILFHVFVEYNLDIKIT